METRDEHLVKLGKYNVCEGREYEPRLFYELFTFPLGRQVVFSEDGVFKNGNEWPIRITHILAAMRPAVSIPSPAVAPNQGDERLIQRYGLRIKGHDTFYMSDLFTPFPLWHNVESGVSDSVLRGTSVWKFDQPWPLASRDTIQVDVQLQNAPTANTNRRVGITFHGYGDKSKRPYQFPSYTTLTDVTSTQLPVDNLRNAGGEVVWITEMEVFCSAENTASNPAGDISQLLLSIRHLGSGTQRPWNIGPTVVVLPRAPALLYGPSMGRAIVHRLPKGGWLWQPDEGVQPEIFSFDTTRSVVEGVWLGMLGYMILT